MDAFLARLHHLGYATAVVAVAVVIGYFWGPRQHGVSAPVPSQAPIVAAPGTVQREVQAALEAEALRAAVAAAPPAYARPAVNAVKPLLKGYSAGEVASILSALGRQKTAPVIHVDVVAPTPAPTIAPPPDVSSADAAWHHRDVYDATAEALKATKIQVSVTQEPVPPSRMQSLLLSDQSAGVAYAVRRRGQLDLDVGFTERGSSVRPVAGVAYQLKGTQAGLFAGVSLQQGRPRAALGFAISF